MIEQIIRIQVGGQIEWKVAKSNSGVWIAVCDPLGLTMEGDSLDDLYENIKDSVQLLMVDLLESGELNAFLQKRGWRLATQVAQKGPVKFDVPIGLLVHSNHDSARNLLQ